MKNESRQFAAVLVGVLAGCAPPAETQRVVTRGLEEAERSVAAEGPTGSKAATTGRPLATVDGRSITLEQVKTALIEAAGGVVLEEAVLDELLAREAEARGVRISADDIAAERTRLIETFGTGGVARSADEAERLLRSIRAARGLGEARFAALVRRNATMRALVRDEVVMTDAALDQAREFRHGPRYRARLIVAATAAEATEALRRIDGGENFSVVAAEVSVDASAARGGVLEAISPADASYPSAVRSALRSMKEGEHSPPIAVESGFAILRLDEIVPASSAGGVNEAALERDVRTAQERVLMTRLARRLLDSARITILDRSLDEAWRVRRTGEY